MSAQLQPDPSRQSLGRELTSDEVALAAAIQAAFAKGLHDSDAVAQSLQASGVARPSGDAGEWTGPVLEQEIRDVNASLDKAYATHGRERLS